MSSWSFCWCSLYYFCDPKHNGSETLRTMSDSWNGWGSASSTWKSVSWQTHHRGQKCHEESRWESCLYIYENEQRHKERMWKKDLDHYVHDSQRVIHDEVYELLSAHSGVSSIKSYHQIQSGSQWHCRIVCFGRLVGRPESSEPKKNNCWIIHTSTRVPYMDSAHFLCRS